VVRSLWSALGGAPESLARLSVVREGAWLGGALPVDDFAVGAVACALLAASDLAQARGAGAPDVQLSGEHAALSFHSERLATLDGNPLGAGFAPLSRFVRCANGGWARTHGNYPHHAAALLRALGIDPPGAHTVRALEAAALALDALELEQAVFAAGGCAAAVRTAGQWAAHPAGAAAAADALVAYDDRGARAAGSLPQLRDPARPAHGVRVLDLTRVIAGPVAGRTLAALGAEVLRVDPPELPEIQAQHLDGDAGKRTALLDLADAPLREALLGGADVVLSGYRPGSLERFGMRADQLAERHPHLVHVSLSAWGTGGPWARRRGFDSLVQAASGIAAECAGPDGAPGALPAQALDHATGHLMAAAALLALGRRQSAQPCPAPRLSLARTAAQLLAAPRPQAVAGELTGRADAASHRVAFGRLSLIAPPGSLNGVPLAWDHGPRPFGPDAPRWPGGAAGACG